MMLAPALHYIVVVPEGRETVAGGKAKRHHRARLSPNQRPGGARETLRSVDGQLHQRFSRTSGAHRLGSMTVRWFRFTPPPATISGPSRAIHGSMESSSILGL